MAEDKLTEAYIRESQRCKEKNTKLLNSMKEKIDSKKDEPHSRKRLYGFETLFNGCKYFDTEAELVQYIGIDWFSDYMFIIDFLGSFAGQKDVIRKTYSNGTTIYERPLNEEYHATYGINRTVSEDEPVWTQQYGSLREEYEVFRTRGCIFEDDIFARYDALYNLLKGVIEGAEEKDSQKVKQL